MVTYCALPLFLLQKLLLARELEKSNSLVSQGLGEHLSPVSGELFGVSRAFWGQNIRLQDLLQKMAIFCRMCPDFCLASRERGHSPGDQPCQMVSFKTPPKGFKSPPKARAQPPGAHSHPAGAAGAAAENRGREQGQHRFKCLM